ncbi:MAG: hypothetical protein A2066_10880 [Bacteroidetes bacterium GWB2_41_8]|nr:MAG: hypothetical protein A2066_10880 [Bacteroidetes bacterium GWB2_41_8]
MKILDPKENIAGIISLIESAKEFIVFISPYNYLEGWDKLKRSINEASARGVKVSWYVRAGEGSNGLEGLNIEVFEVPLLHVKMFFSENEAIISSFHLMNNQDINWACVLDYPEEYKEMVSFFETFIWLARELIK